MLTSAKCYFCDNGTEKMNINGENAVFCNNYERKAGVNGEKRRFCRKGDSMRENHNSGYFNSGDYNFGDFNTGNRNAGDYNTGNYNTGNYNTGEYNTGDHNAGCFNTAINPTISMFNKQSGWTMAKWKASDARYVVLYLMSTQKDKQSRWDGLSEEDKAAITSLPNFDAYIFEECTGIRVDVPDKSCE